MEKLLAALHLDDPASLKRALTTILGAVTLLGINPLLAKWNIPPIDDANLAMVAGLLATSILQSGANSVTAKLAAAKAAGDAAADKVKTIEDAKKVFDEVKP